MKIYILLPALNERKSLQKLVPEISETLQNSDHEIVVIDDGSYDGTSRLFSAFSESYNLICLKHGENKGMGAALKTGFCYLLKKAGKDDILITMDADNTHRPEVIEKITEKLKSADIVIASRFIKGGRQEGVPAVRRFLSQAAGVVFKIFFPIPGVNDYTSGYRGYRVELLKDYYKEKGMLPITESGFPATAEILIRLYKYRARIYEVPFILRYDLKKGKSKIKIFRTVIRYVFLVLKLKVVPKK